MGIVSIIVCCYNGIKYIEQCFSYILSQTYPEIEVLFVDDGSTDDSFKYALSFEDVFVKRGFTLKCFTQENKGAGGAAALGILNATGDFISCFDVDDVLYPVSIEKRVSFLVNNKDYGGVRTNGYKISSDGKTKSLFVYNEEEKLKTDIFSDLLFGRTNNWSGSYMVRSSALWKVFPDHHIIESRFGQNLQILMSVAYHNKIGFIDIPLMEYVYNPTSFTNSGKTLKDKLLNYEGYKSIRLSILKQLNITDELLYKQLESCYLKIYMDLALEFKDISLYMKCYEHLLRLERPLYIYSYYYHKIKKNILLAFYYRVKSRFTY